MLPPGPRGFELLPRLQQRRRDPIGFYTGLARDYGPVAFFKVGSLSYCLIDDADLIRYVLQENAKNYTKGPGYERLKAIVGEGLLTSEGEHWRKQRKLSQPAFHRERIAGLAGQMGELTKRLVDSWNQKTITSSAHVDVLEEMTSVTLAIAGSTLLGEDTSQHAGAVTSAVSKALKHSERLGVTWLRILDLFSGSRDRNLAFRLERMLPTRANREFNSAMATLDGIVAGMIAHRRESGSKSNDLLSMLMASHDEDTGEGMSDRELRDEVMSLFLAGHETTATALCWAVRRLELEPEMHKKIAEECTRVLGEKMPDLETMHALPYTKAFFDEILRMTPPFWRFTRQATSEDRIGGYSIPAGTVVMISPYVTHRNPKYWNEPERFNPERFLGEAAASLPKHAYIPFGAGPRVCIGNHFALLEGIIVLSALARGFNFATPEGRVVAFDPHITLRPAGGMPMQISRRTS